METMYEKMKAKGIDMSWYEKNKKRVTDVSAIPLDDEKCSPLSIYLLKRNGSLWTVDKHGFEYKKVREGKKELPREVYICVCCKGQWGGVLNEKGEVGHPTATIEEA